MWGVDITNFFQSGSNLEKELHRRSVQHINCTHRQCQIYKNQLIYESNTTLDPTFFFDLKKKIVSDMKTNYDLSNQLAYMANLFYELEAKKIDDPLMQIVQEKISYARSELIHEHNWIVSSIIDYLTECYHLSNQLEYIANLFHQLEAKKIDDPLMQIAQEQISYAKSELIHEHNLIVSSTIDYLTACYDYLTTTYIQ